MSAEQTRSNAATHEEQVALRERMMLAEVAIAEEVRRFEADTGIRVRGMDVTRFDNGAYRALLRLAVRV